MLISDVIRKGLGGNVDVSVLMGANVAVEVARGDFCEATLGYSVKSNALAFQYAFESPSFHVRLTNDSIGVELCGGLKTIVGIGAGISDGLGYGRNTKAAIIRLGMVDMIKFGEVFFSGVQHKTFLESCGIADVIAECFGGRNRRCAEICANRQLGRRGKRVLLGQKLTGTLTLARVYELLVRDEKTEEFPFFSIVYRFV